MQSSQNGIERAAVISQPIRQKHNICGLGLHGRKAFWQYRLTMTDLGRTLAPTRLYQLRLVGCRIEFVSAQAARRVRVFPLDRAGVGRVGVDIATKFTRQIGDRCEDAARNDLAFDFGEPEFDLATDWVLCAERLSRMM